MKLKIISDGSAWNTKVINADTGEEIENVASTTWTVSADNRVARATIEIVNVPVEVSAEGRKVYVTNFDLSQPSPHDYDFSLDKR